MRLRGLFKLPDRKWSEVKWNELLSPDWLFATPWTLCSMEFSRPEYWSGQPFPSPGDLPNPGIEPASAAKSLQLYPTLCSSVDGSPQGLPVPGILQARTLEWVAISFSSAWKWKVKVKTLSRVRLLADTDLICLPYSDFTNVSWIHLCVYLAPCNCIMCVDLCAHHHSQDKEQFHTPAKSRCETVVKPSPLSVPGNHLFLFLCLYGFGFSRMLCKWNHMICNLSVWPLLCAC